MTYHNSQYSPQPMISYDKLQQSVHMIPIKLGYQVPSHEDLVSYSSGLRPYRDEGIRLEEKELGKKTVYHNYGHGGGGLSIGWGCARYVINQFFVPRKAGKQIPIVVIGAGVVGLSTSVQLVEMGYSVIMYADSFAYVPKNKQPELTTTVAAGLWMPMKLKTKTSVKQLTMTSWDHFQETLTLQNSTNQKLGIESMKLYIIGDDKAQMYGVVKDIIPLESVKVQFGDGVVYDAVSFQTFIIETQFYIPYLLKKLEASGKFKLVDRRISSLHEVMEMESDHIFNCMGLQSKKVFQDPSGMKPIKGHLAKMKAYPKMMDYSLFLKSGDRWILHIPHRQSQKLNIGITYQENNGDPFPDKAVVDKLISTSRDFFLKVENNIRQTPKL